MKWLDVFRVRDENRKKRGGGVPYEKEFDRWNETKKNLHKSRRRAWFSEREIWWCRMGVNIGYEIDGKQKMFVRPVLILKKISADTFVGIPLTKKIKNVIIKKNVSHLYHILKEDVQGDDGKTYCSVLDLSQIRLFDARRLVNRRHRIHDNVFEKVQDCLQSLLF